MSKKSKKRKRQAVQTFAEPVAKVLPRQQLLSEIGISGDKFEDTGLTVDPWNDQLDGPEWFEKVDEMRRACAPVQAVEFGITLPVADTEWSVEAESDELREFVEYALFEAPSTPWPDVIRRAALSAVYGTWVFEIVWKEDEGRLVPRRFADRLPRSIAGYNFGPENDLVSITQKGANAEGDEVEVEIPTEKLLLFPYRLEGQNWNGLSALRFAWSHYYAQRFLTQFSSIGAERGISGLPYVTMPANANDQDQAKALALAKAARRHEAAGLALPFGYAIDQLSSMSPKELLDLIRYHRTEISRGCLLDFIYLGDGGDGSLALGDRKIRFASMAWNYLATSIAGVANRHLIKPLMLLNYPSAKPADYPKIVPSTVGLAMILEQMSDFLQATVAGGLVLPDAEGRDENFFRGIMGLPLRTDEELAATRAAKKEAAPSPPAPLPPNRGEGSQAGNGAQQAAPLQAFAARERTMTFAAADVDRAVQRVAGDMAAAEDAWQRQGRVHLVGWLQSLLSQLDALQGDVTRAGEVMVPPGLVDAYADWIAEWLTAAWDAAARTMAQSLTPSPSPTQQGRGESAPAPAARLQAKASMIAQHHAEAARFEVVMAALRGQTGEAIGAAFAEAMSTRLRGELPVAGREIAEAVS